MYIFILQWDVIILEVTDIFATQALVSEKKIQYTLDKCLWYVTTFYYIFFLFYTYCLPQPCFLFNEQFWIYCFHNDYWLKYPMGKVKYHSTPHHLFNCYSGCDTRFFFLTLHIFANIWLCWKNYIIIKIK